jgi:hypothetical protein
MRATSIVSVMSSRVDYFLTRDEVAARIRAARKSKRTHHIARMLLIGWYTGTRPGATLALRWVPSSDGGMAQPGQRGAAPPRRDGEDHQ